MKEKILLSITDVLVDISAIIFILMECLYRILKDTLVIIISFIFLLITSPFLLTIFLIMGLKNERRN